MSNSPHADVADVHDGHIPEEEDTIEVPLKDSHDQYIYVTCSDLPATPAETVVQILVAEQVPLTCYLRFALEYYKRDKADWAMEVMEHGLQAAEGAPPTQQSPMLNLAASLSLDQARRLSRSPASAESAEGIRLRIQKATAWVNRASTLTQLDPLTLTTRGILNLMNQKPEDAARAFGHALQSDPANKTALLGRAHAHYSLQQYREALRLYRHLLVLGLSTPDPRVPIGLCLSRLGREEEARAAFARAEEVARERRAADPSAPDVSNLADAHAYLGLSLLNRFKKTSIPEYIDAGRAELMQAFALDPIHPAAVAGVVDQLFWMGLAHPSSPQGDTWMAEAEALAERTIQGGHSGGSGGPELADAHFQLGRIAHARGGKDGLDGAYSHYRRAVAYLPGHRPAAFGLARLLIGQRKYAEAVDMLQGIGATTASKHDPEVEAVLGSLYAQTEPASAKSLAALQRVYEAPADTPIPTDPRERARAGDGRMELAMAYIRTGQSGGVGVTGSTPSLTKAHGAVLDAIRVYGGEASAPTEALIALAVVAQTLGSEAKDATLLAEASRIYDLTLSKCDRSLSDPENTDPTHPEGISGEGEIAWVISQYNRGILLEGQDRWPEALTVYSDIAARHPGWLEGRVRLARAREEVDIGGRGSEAVKAEWAAIATLAGGQQSGTASLALAGRAVKERARDPRTARKLYQPLADAGDVWAACGVGVQLVGEAERLGADKAGGSAAAAAREGALRRAADMFGAALRADERCAWAANGLGVVLAHLDLGPEARAILGQVREMAPECGEAWVNAAWAYAAGGQHAEASILFTQAIRRFPRFAKDPQIWLGAAKSAFVEGRIGRDLRMLERSLCHVQKALHLAPTLLMARFDLTLVLQTLAELLVDGDTDVEDAFSSSHPEVTTTGEPDQSSFLLGPSSLDRASSYIDQTEGMLGRLVKDLEKPGREREKARLLRSVQQRRSFIQYLRRQVSLRKKKAEDTARAFEARTEEERRRKEAEDEQVALANSLLLQQTAAEEAKISELKRKAWESAEQYSALDRSVASARASNSASKKQSNDDAFIAEEDDTEMEGESQSGSIPEDADAGSERKRRKGSKPSRKLKTIVNSDEELSD